VFDGDSSVSMTNPSSLSFISSYVHDIHLPCLLDTGATHSFIHTSIVRRLRNVSITNIKQRFTLADGNTNINIIGIVHLNLRIGQITTPISALISKSLSHLCILGQDWMNKYSVDICHSTQHVIIHTAGSSVTVPMDHRITQHHFPLKSTIAIIIPPQHERIIELQSPVSSSPQALFHPNRFLQSHNLVAIPHALLSIDKYRTYTTVINPTNRICRIPINTTIGTFTIPPSNIECHSISPSPTLNQTTPSSVLMSSDLNVSTSLDQIFNEVLDHLSDPDQKLILHQLLNQHKCLFDTSVPSIANLTAPPMINTGSHLPIHSRVYRTDPIKQKHLTDTINEMLTYGQIEKSYASWSSPVILVKKKDDSYRFVVDYRSLNNITERDCYPLPRIDDTLNRLNGNNYFTKLDLKSGYHQIRIHSDDKDKSTFVTSHGTFRFNVMPQGLKNSPSNFQRLMYDLLVNSRWDYTLVYLDDVIIFSRTFNEHTHHLNEILSTLSSARLQLNPQKCSFVKSEIDYLGHTINGQGIRPLQSNIDAILQIPVPSTPRQVHSFVQAANYYRDHIENFSKVAAPLFLYTKKNAVWKGWTDAMNNAFIELKQRLTEPPIFLNFPEDDGQFILSTDASGEGMGGVLRQMTSNGLKVIKYVSKKFNLAQKKYSTTERECLALVWCIQKLKEYVWGRPIEVETDHCPLCSFNKKKFLNSRIDRWQVELSEYYITKIIYKRGRCNCDADLLSRFPYDESDIDDNDHPHRIRSFTSTPTRPPELVQLNVITRSKSKAIQQSLSSTSSSSTSSSPTVPLSSDSSINQHRSIVDIYIDRIRIEQMKDVNLSNRIKSILTQPDQYPHEIVDDGVLYKLINRTDGSIVQLPWLPTSLIPDVLFLYHDHPMSGHFGVTRTFHKVREQFFFPRMYDHIKRYIRSCSACAQFNVQRQKKPGFLQCELPPDGVFEIMQMDFWKAPICSSNDNQYVLIITDRLSKFVFARALPSASGAAAAEMLLEDIILKHGSIRYLQSDQGSHFRNELLSAITALTGCQQVFSIPYHPMSNGQVERFNSTFCDQLKKYCHHNLTEWDTYLSAVVWAYNSTVHSTTQFIPYELAFNRRPLSPFVSTPPAIKLMKPHDYWEKANRFKSFAIRSARINIQQQQIANKTRYDQGRRHPVYKPGDFVWLKPSTNRSKFDVRFDGPFVIIDRLNQVKYLIEHTTLGYRQYEHLNNLIPFYDRD
jgi:transposase InsO family protein